MSSSISCFFCEFYLVTKTLLYIFLLLLFCVFSGTVYSQDTFSTLEGGNMNFKRSRGTIFRGTIRLDAFLKQNSLTARNERTELYQLYKIPQKAGLFLLLLAQELKEVANKQTMTSFFQQDHIFLCNTFKG